MGTSFEYSGTSSRSVWTGSESASRRKRGMASSCRVRYVRVRPDKRTVSPDWAGIVSALDGTMAVLGPVPAFEPGSPAASGPASGLLSGRVER